MDRGRVLGVDPGERRVGLAVSDETRMIARPLLVLGRRRGTRQLVDDLQVVVQKEEISQIVVGLPLNADGSEGSQAKRSRALAAVLARALARPVALWDERLSTREAENAARERGHNLKRLRSTGAIDALAAAVILQSFLDRNITSDRATPSSVSGPQAASVWPERL